MIDLFFDYAPGKLAEAQAAGERTDWLTLQKAVHPLKTSALHVGAVALSQLAADIEAQARQQTDAGLPDLLRRFDEAYRTVQPMLAEKRRVLAGA